jgi:hypothetical protein
MAVRAGVCLDAISIWITYERKWNDEEVLPLKSEQPTTGFEPVTYGLRNRCSTG